MPSILANSLVLRNTYSLVRYSVANCYGSGMRGKAKQKTRAERLKLLNRRYTFEDMAGKIETNPRYLSQIANEVIQKGGKSPRALSDDYATRLEAAYSLGDGWFDQPVEADEIKEEPGTYNVGLTAERFESLSESRKALIMAIANSNGCLSDQQIAALRQLIVGSGTD